MRIKMLRIFREKMSPWPNFMLEHTQELLDLHTDLLERFREATKPQPKIKLSQIFIDFRERFLIYGDYCSKLTLATDTLRDFCKNDNTISDLVNVSIHFQIKFFHSIQRTFSPMNTAMPKRLFGRKMSITWYLISANATNPKISLIVG